MSWRDRLPRVRGALIPDAVLAPYTWLRVGGPADLLYLPKDLADLQYFLQTLDPKVPLYVLGVGSNTLVRDGGIEGVVVRLGKGFAGLDVDGLTVTAGAAVLDGQLSRAAADAGVCGLEFLTGVPGAVGGACVMNAGCYGAETKDVLIEAHLLDRRGRAVTLTNAEMGFSYRRSAGVEGLIVTGARFEGRRENPAAIRARMSQITTRRETSQPIREKTGGSTFKNPKGASGEALAAWRLVDEAGWRGRPFGEAMISPLHANFLINAGQASAADLEGLGEAIRADVLAKFGVVLEWEIKRVGRPLAPNKASKNVA